MTPAPMPAASHVCLAIPDNEISLIPEDADELPHPDERFS